MDSVLLLYKVMTFLTTKMLQIAESRGDKEIESVHQYLELAVAQLCTYSYLSSFLK